MNIRLAGICPNSLVNGPGMRRVLFAQGCKHNCKGCFNPDTHDFNGGEIKDCDKIIEDIISDPIIKGVTFSGGDPFEQAESFAYIAKEIKKKRPEMNIWSYTGYELNHLIMNANDENKWMDLLESIDVLVDGKFSESDIKEGIKFRGSDNQIIWEIKNTIEDGEETISFSIKNDYYDNAKLV